MSSKPDFFSTPSQYPLFICCHPFSTTNRLLIENRRSIGRYAPLAEILRRGDICSTLGSVRSAASSAATRPDVRCRGDRRTDR